MVTNSIRDAAAIVGIGETPFARRLEASEKRLAVQAILAALADAGIDPGEVDGLASYTLESTDEVEIAIIGTAYAGQDPVERVEITFDDGESWEDCTLDYAPGANIWALWRYNWTPEQRGRQRVRTRVTTASGAMSVEDPSGTSRLIGYDAGMEVELLVQ